MSLFWLIIARRKLFSRNGDAFFSYLFLYGAGRLVIEQMRTDSLYAGSSVRVSQVLSMFLCLFVLLRYTRILYRSGRSAALCFTAVPLAAAISVFVLLYTLTGAFLSSLPVSSVIPVLAACALLMILVFIAVFLSVRSVEVRHADDMD